MFKIESAELFPPSGVLLLSPRSLNPIAYNWEAIQILAFPAHPGELKRLPSFLAGEVQSKLATGSFIREPHFVSEFKSGNRTYLCRSSNLHFEKPRARAGGSAATTVLLLERQPSILPFLKRRMFEEFGLTQRERQIVELLVLGITTKEIAQSMNLSPNTVKSFLHLIMTKMNVSTRVGIIGKILGTKVC